MFSITRRTTTIALVAASALAPAAIADAASAGHHHGGHGHGPGQGYPPPYLSAGEQTGTMALLLPAVQAARESPR